MIIIGICYTVRRLGTQTVAPPITGFKYLKICIQYLDGHPHKKSYPFDPYDVSNIIILTWSGTKFEDYTILSRHGSCQNYQQYTSGVRNYSYYYWGEV